MSCHIVILYLVIYTYIYIYIVFPYSFLFDFPIDSPFCIGSLIDLPVGSVSLSRLSFLVKSCLGRWTPSQLRSLWAAFSLLRFYAATTIKSCAILH